MGAGIAEVLARSGIAVVGVEADETAVARARERASGPRWVGVALPGTPGRRGGKMPR